MRNFFHPLDVGRIEEFVGYIFVLLVTVVWDILTKVVDLIKKQFKKDTSGR